MSVVLNSKCMPFQLTQSNINQVSRSCAFNTRCPPTRACCHLDVQAHPLVKSVEQELAAWISWSRIQIVSSMSRDSNKSEHLDVELTLLQGLECRVIYVVNEYSMHRLLSETLNTDRILCQQLPYPEDVSGL